MGLWDLEAAGGREGAEGHLLDGGCYIPVLPSPGEAGPCPGHTGCRDADSGARLRANHHLPQGKAPRHCVLWGVWDSETPQRFAELGARVSSRHLREKLELKVRLIPRIQKTEGLPHQPGSYIFSKPAPVFVLLPCLAQASCVVPAKIGLIFPERFLLFPENKQTRAPHNSHPQGSGTRKNRGGNLRWRPGRVHQGERCSGRHFTGPPHSRRC